MSKAIEPPQTVEMKWSITFTNTFDIRTQFTQVEFVELVKTHLAEMQKQFPELLQKYPKEFFGEMAKRQFLDADTFQKNGEGNH